MVNLTQNYFLITHEILDLIHADFNRFQNVLNDK